MLTLYYFAVNKNWQMGDLVAVLLEPEKMEIPKLKLDQGTERRG